jgi:hypothetical protein
MEWMRKTQFYLVSQAAIILRPVLGCNICTSPARRLLNARQGFAVAVCYYTTLARAFASSLKFRESSDSVLGC